MDPVARLMLDYLNNVMYEPEQAVLDLQELPREFRDLGEGLTYFSECVMESVRLAKAIAAGQLDVPLPPPENEVAAPLKSLHASLKHLTWQTQQIAKGDYQQRVDYMGDFSEAFNVMVERLQQRRVALLDEIHTLVQNKSLYETLVGQIEQWIVVTDASTSERLFVSRELEETLTADGTALLLDQWLKEQAESMKGKDEICVTEFEMPNKGKTCYYSVSIHPLQWNKRKALAFVLTDVSLERERLNKLQNIADLDPLTQIYNRRFGMEMLEKWIAQGKNFILCFVDIDNLKYVNDKFGHTEGDEYILSVSEVIGKFSEDVVVCRIGGDEFMLLAENWNIDEAKERLEVLRKELSGREGAYAAAYERSISYGVIPVGVPGSYYRLQASDLLSAADEKMYEYKRAYKLRRKQVPVQ
ncbi:MAG: GGDEF domain-containing protein [Muricomes sp.]